MNDYDEQRIGNEDDERSGESGRAGWIMLWALGVPIPVLLVLFALRGCT